MPRAPLQGQALDRRTALSNGQGKSSTLLPKCSAGPPVAGRAVPGTVLTPGMQGEQTSRSAGLTDSV